MIISSSFTLKFDVEFADVVVDVLSEEWDFTGMLSGCGCG